MRIAVISDLWVPFPGGAERFCFNISRELKRRGHEIFVLTSYANAAEFDGIKPFWKSIGVHCYDDQPGHTHADGWNDIQKFLTDCRAEVIFTHHFFANEFMDEFVATRLPIIQLVHSGKRDLRVDLAIFNSDFTCKSGNPYSQDMVIIPPAFEDIVAESHGLYIGFIKPIKHKGVDFLYELAAHISNRDFMVLHGEWHEHEDVRRGIPNVFFMPPVHEMKTFYEKCRIMLVPSLHEDAGTVPQEAALNRLPCISSDVMGLAQTNHGGIVLPHDVSLWAAEIDRLDNPVYYAQIAQRQKDYIASINWKAQFDALSERVNAFGR
jgi:glycosyltransferase involved in cell wall biosynthesis